MYRILAVSLCVVAAACGGSKSSPTSPQTSSVLQGQTVSAVDGTGTGQVSIQLGSRFAIQSDADGNFSVDVGGPSTFTTVMTGSRIVERHTSITGPTSDRMKVALIPSSFDLAAFDEMFRGSNNRLQRWTTRPSLVIVGTVMKYVNSNTDRYEASGERLTDDEVAAMTAHLNEGLALLTGGTHTAFASVQVEWPGAGEQVTVRRIGSIVVGRYTGVRNLAQTIGYGTWAEQADGTVVGGAMWLDRDFDRDDAGRRLLRIHELGHALGYNHVTVRPSIMNPSLGPSPTDFDRAAPVIAFQRPVGNTSPDTDPGVGPRTFAVAEGPATWATPVR
jgi:hypothetical protein